MTFTRKFIEARFGLAMDAIGAKRGDTYTAREDGNGYVANVGVYFIDHAPVYGGYTIRKIATEGGGESTPFGTMRYSPKEFVAHLDGILGAARIIKENGQCGY